jgi:outer membrane biosynthesis protein TonB
VPYFVDADPWKVVFILPDHSHFSPENDGFCAHCGQPLPTPEASYGRSRNNRVGIIVTLLLHLLLIVVYLFQPHTERHAAPPSGVTMVYIGPQTGKPKPKQQQAAPKKAPKKAPKTPPVQIQRLPNTITLPNEKPVEVVKAEPKPITPPAEVDMSAYIEARRKQRGAAQNDAPAEESENDRASRIAKANIAAANGRSRGDDRNESGGVFSISNKTFHSADLKFRGWNPNFKRRWLQQVEVEQGAEADIETAIVKKMIELIRKEKTGDFEWDSHRLQRVVTMSARLQDTAELQAFLFKEMFPEYKPPAR